MCLAHGQVRAVAVQPGEERARGYLTHVGKYLGGSKEATTELCLVVSSERTRGSVHKLTHGKCHRVPRKEQSPHCEGG